MHWIITSVFLGVLILAFAVLFFQIAFMRKTIENREQKIISLYKEKIDKVPAFVEIMSKNTDHKDIFLEVIHLHKIAIISNILSIYDLLENNSRIHREFLFLMKVSVRLPLTLAIMDGMSVGVGGEVYIPPLSSVVESFQVRADSVSTVGQGSQLVKVRDEYMPVIALEKIFQVPRFDSDKLCDIMVVVEADGSRVALLVDELLGQQQVVVKNLESNYRKVPNVSGATILGDGKVALILDTGALVRRSRH